MNRPQRIERPSHGRSVVRTTAISTLTVLAILLAIGLAVWAVLAVRDTSEHRRVDALVDDTLARGDATMRTVHQQQEVERLRAALLADAAGDEAKTLAVRRLDDAGVRAAYTTWSEQRAASVRARIAPAPTP